MQWAGKRTGSDSILSVPGPRPLRMLSVCKADLKTHRSWKMSADEAEPTPEAVPEATPEVKEVKEAKEPKETK